MTKIERFLKMAQATGQLKKLRWEEEDRAEQNRIRQSLLNLMTPEEYAALKSGLVTPEDLGVGEKTPVPELNLPKFESRKFEGLKREPSGLGMGKAKGLRFKPAPETPESPFGELPSFADVEPQHYEKLSRLMTALSGAKPTDISTRWKQLAGTIEKQPYEYEALTKEEIPEASRIATKLKAGATKPTEGTDRQYAMGLAEKRERDETLTEFEQGFLDRYEKKTLSLPNLISAYNQAANVMLGGDEDSPRAKFLSRKIAKMLAVDKDDIALFVRSDTMQKFKTAFESSPAYQNYVDNPEVFLDLKNLAEMWYNTYWDEEE